MFNIYDFIISSYFDETTLLLKPKSKTTRTTPKTTSAISSTGTDEDITGNRGASTGNTIVSHYGTYCLRRAKTLTASFEELARVGIGMKTENICTQVGY